MDIEFRKVSSFSRGTLFDLLADAYSFDQRCSECWDCDWQQFDDFFFNNLHIADKCGFITTLNGKAIGFVSWDPRNMPDYVEIGHNCIASKYKGNGYGRLQLRKAVRRISLNNDVKKIIVTTNGILKPAQRMYEGAGFKLIKTRKNVSDTKFTGEYMDYEYHLNQQE